MCGIVGFTGHHAAAPILLEGLSKLEYRGYDSAGLAVRDGTNPVRIVKAKGRLRALADKNGQRPGPAVDGTMRHRPHPLGYPWRAQRKQRPPPRLRRRERGSRGPQRHHRKLSGAPGEARLRKGYHLLPPTRIPR